MASKRDLRSYFSAVSEKKKKTGSSTFSIKPIVVAETSEVTQAEVDTARSQVKNKLCREKAIKPFQKK